MPSKNWHRVNGSVWISAALIAEVRDMAAKEGRPIKELIERFIVLGMRADGRNAKGGDDDLPQPGRP